MTVRGEVSAAAPSPGVEPLLTLTEVADWLRVPKATVYEWRRYGRGPKAYRVGRGLRFRPDDVLAWLDSRVC